MSRLQIQNAYFLGMILTLLFGVGLGFQISQWVNDAEDKDNKTEQTTSTVGKAKTVTSPKVSTEVYVRTGSVLSISGNSISFSANVQNSDSTYTKTTLTATVDTSTTLSKIMRDATTAPSAISLSDIAPNSEIAVESAENIYGKTAFTAKAVQLHSY